MYADKSLFEDNECKQKKETESLISDDIIKT